MYIKLCDRCGRNTNNLPAYLLPSTKETGAYCVDKQWFGKPVCLCDECLKEFRIFQTRKKFHWEYTEEN